MFDDQFVKHYGNVPSTLTNALSKSKTFCSTNRAKYSGWTSYDVLIRRRSQLIMPSSSLFDDRFVKHYGNVPSTLTNALSKIKTFFWTCIAL